MSNLRRPLWIWNTKEVITSLSATADLLSSARRASVTDFYLYLDASHYERYHTEIRSFIGQARSTCDISVWALEGGRVYFSDSDGPAYFYSNIENLVSYNAHVAATEKFVGFSADLEPHSKSPRASFHSGVAHSSLDSRAGTGVWKKSQAADRAALLRDWIQIHNVARLMLHVSGLRLSAAFPHWVHSYQGEGLHVRWPTDASPLQGAMDLLMACVDEYVVMSYDTDPQRAANRVIEQLKCAASIAGRPRVLAAVETITGVGGRISYGDDPAKKSKAIVLRDMATIVASLRQYEAFGGVAIHAWSGWSRLPD